MQDQDLDWGKYVWLCTDQAASMVGCHSGATAKIKKIANKNMLYTHCIYRCKPVIFNQGSARTVQGFRKCTFKSESLFYYCIVRILFKYTVIFDLLNSIAIT